MDMELRLSTPNVTTWQDQITMDTLMKRTEVGVGEVTVGCQHNILTPPPLPFCLFCFCVFVFVFALCFVCLLLCCALFLCVSFSVWICVCVNLVLYFCVCVFVWSTCETWTITADIERRIQALEMRCFRKLLGISYTDHITNEEVKARIGNAIGPYEDLLTTVKRRKLKWFGHVTRSSGLAKTILQGTVQGGRRSGRQRKWWEDNIKEWTGLPWNIMLRKAENREEWRKLVVKSTVVPQRSARLRDR